MSLFIVDVEADGPYPGDFSMVSFGIVKVQDDLTTTPTFYGKVAPVSDKWLPEALAVSGHTREEHLTFDAPGDVMALARSFVEQHNTGKATLISDNNGFDAMFMTYYMGKYAGSNPFGFSSRRIGDLYAGLTQDFFAASKWKSLRKTTHDHNPVNDALGNAEALIQIARKFSLKLPT